MPINEYDLSGEVPPKPFRYVIYDEDGNLTGNYLQLLQPAHVNNYIPVQFDFVSEWLNYRANDARDGVELIVPAAEPGDDEVPGSDEAAEAPDPVPDEPETE